VAAAIEGTLDRIFREPLGLGREGPLGVKTAFREQDKWYFVDEQSFRYRGAMVSAFIEATRFYEVKIRLDLENIGERRNGDMREFYRPEAPIAELPSQSPGRREWLRLTVSKQF
jgi:hypothetical protein